MPRKESESGWPDLRPRALWLLYGLALCLALVPIVVTPILPLVDMPNHMARVHILNHLDSSPDLQKYYSTDWHLLAYQSTDLLMPPLARAFGTLEAARIFAAATLIVLFGGAVALHRALFGRFGLWPLSATLFLYSLPFAWGFLSSLFSTGVALLLLAGWIATEGRARVVRVAAFSLATLVLLAFHFFAFATYAVLIAAYEFGRIWLDPDRNLKRAVSRLVEGGLPFAAPCILVLASLRSEGPTVTSYGSFADVALGVVSPIASYLTWPDFVLAFAVVFGAWFCWRSGSVRFSPVMRLPLLAMVVTGALIPVWLFNVWGANFRIPTLLGFLVASSMELRAGSGRKAALFVFSVFGLLLIRVATITAIWHGYSTDYLEFQAATENIRKGSRVLVLPVEGDGGSWPAPQTYPYRQLAALAVVERDVFYPTLFAMTTPLAMPGVHRGMVENVQDAQHPLEWRPADARFASATPDTIRAVGALGETGLLRGSYFSPVDWSRWPEDYDYFIVFDFGRKENPVPELLTPVAVGRFFTIFQIHPPGAPAAGIP